MSASDPHDDDPALDRLLAQARWEEPSAADEYRLREEWTHLRRRSWIGPVLTLAAAAAVVIGVGLIVLKQEPPVPIVRNTQPDAPIMLVTHGEDKPRVESRPANLMERLLAMQPAPQGVAQPVVMERDPELEQLIRQLNDPLMQRRFDAARALASADQPRVVPILEEMVDRDDDNRAALAALMLSKTPVAADALARVRSSRTVDAQFLALAGDAQFLALKEEPQ